LRTDKNLEQILLVKPGLILYFFSLKKV